MEMLFLLMDTVRSWASASFTLIFKVPVMVYTPSVTEYFVEKVPLEVGEKYIMAYMSANW